MSVASPAVDSYVRVSVAAREQSCVCAAAFNGLSETLEGEPGTVVAPLPESGPKSTHPIRASHGSSRRESVILGANLRRGIDVPFSEYARAVNERPFSGHR
jgi:hypothetical protein